MKTLLRTALAAPCTLAAPRVPDTRIGRKDAVGFSMPLVQESVHP
jgi:hypothetical protein